MDETTIERINLGHASAYAYAKSKGYEGTEDEFAQLCADLGIQVEYLENMAVVTNTLEPGTPASATYEDGVLTLNIPKGEKGDPAPADEVAEATDAWLAQNITNPSNPPLDRSLTLANAAAPADMVGDLRSAFEAFYDIETVDYSEVTTSRWVINSSNKWQLVSASSKTRTYTLPIPDDVYTLEIQGNENGSSIAFLNSYSPVADATPDYSAEYDAMITLEGSQTANYKKTSDMKYLYASIKNSSDVDRTPTVRLFTNSGVLEVKTELEAEINETEQTLQAEIDSFYTDETFDYSSVTGSRWIIASNKWTQVSFSSSARSYTMAIPQGVKQIDVTAGVNGAIITFLKTYSPVADATPDYSTGYERISLSAGENKKYLVGEDMAYFYAVLSTSDGSNFTPTVVMEMHKRDDVEMASAKTLDAFYLDWYLGRWINPDGDVASLSRYALTYGIPVKQGQIITNKSASQDDNDRALVFIVASFNGTTFVQNSRIAVEQNGQYVVPTGADNVRISFGYPSTVENPPDMTTAILDSYFAVAINGFVQPFGLYSDGEHPVYAAFGPSTMEGLKYDNGVRRISRYDPPNYIGRRLNLKTYNFAVSGSGIVARSSGDDNYMDLIYANPDVLSKAQLVTISFGYGNDVDIGLPVGVYTDYYPYDEEGYHPSGVSSTSQMVQKGATVMGCLNWCIKWINEKYPYAQLVIVFGAPSLNRDRAVSMEAQTEGVGVAPYTLTIANPYDNPSQGSLTYGIKQIGIEIAKLKSAFGIPVFNMLSDGCPFSWYSTYAKNPSDDSLYALFGLKSNAWDSHPIDAGYIQYARYLSGQIATLITH